MDSGSQNATLRPMIRRVHYPIDYEAKAECIDNVLSKPYPKDGRVYCNATFDDWLCWDYTPAGTTAFQRCPYEFMAGFNKDAFAEKRCMEDGTWFVNIVNQTWTNYQPCATHQENLSVLMVYISGYLLSAILLIAAIAIFLGFRQLRCTRVILHQHLFLSYILTGLLWTVSYTQLVIRMEVIRSNPAWCKVVHVMTQYISLSNYCWMFNEGFFLHTIIVHAFSKEKKLLRICYVIGWGVPIIPTIAYASVRATLPEEDVDCWIQSNWLLWIISGPITVSLVVNFVFFLNILRILLSKLRANSNEYSQYRRAVKATMIMIPLLGINNLFMLIRPDLDRVGTLVWKIISAFLTAYQGTAVALIFCFFNGEVMTVLRRKWSQWRHTYDPQLSGRLRSTSNTMALTLEESSVPAKNGFPCVSTRTSSKNAQDPTELQVMISSSQKQRGPNY